MQAGLSLTSQKRPGAVISPPRTRVCEPQPCLQPAQPDSREAHFKGTGALVPVPFWIRLPSFLSGPPLWNFLEFVYDDQHLGRIRDLHECILEPGPGANATARFVKL